MINIPPGGTSAAQVARETDYSYDPPARAQTRPNRHDAWAQAVPPIYRHLTVEDLPPGKVDAVRGWHASGDLGLWLAGSSFKGKTATCWLVLLRAEAEAEAGRSWTCVSATEYLEAKRGIQARDEEALIRRAVGAHLLVLDEFPKTLNAGKDIDYLRDLLNRRAAAGRRTVVTANHANGLGPALLQHPDAVVRDAATALHNRLQGMAHIVYPAALPELPAAPKGTTR